MVCENGFFHADPHPGNFFIKPDRTIGLIDFGTVGVLDERTQEHLADLLIYINHQDFAYSHGSTTRRSNSVFRLTVNVGLSPLSELRISAVLIGAGMLIIRQLMERRFLLTNSLGVAGGTAQVLDWCRREAALNLRRTG